VLNAYLLQVPADAGRGVAAALRRAARDPTSALAYVGVLGPATPQLALSALMQTPLLRSPRCSHCPPVAGDRSGLTLGIIDTGADPAQPWFAPALGAMYFRPGTPGERNRHLLRSHGTAMLGVYAQQALGRSLRANDVGLLETLPAAPFAATLIAPAGPENRAGRTDLIRNLAWLASPAGVRPFPDLINYSQGNGPLCARPAGDCAQIPWFGVTRVLDRLIEELDTVVIKSAGNGGYAAGNSMTVPGDTYNGITVGNMHAFDWRTCGPSAERAHHKIYRTSSIAAADGPRLLDLVAPGVRIRTAGVDPAYCFTRCRRGVLPCTFCPRLGRAAADGNFHKTNSGTSPAAAVTGAVAARLLQAGVRQPLRIKALLINSADSWQSGGRAHPSVRGTGAGCREDRLAAAHRPYRYGAHYDRSYGWGYLNAARALAQRAGTTGAALQLGEHRCYGVDLAPWEKISIVWQRRVLTCAGCGHDGWARLSRLELELFDGTAPYRVLDRDATRQAQDNVLQVSNGRGPGNPEPRRTVVRVRLDATHIDGATREPYALAAPRGLQRLAHCPLARAVVLN